MHQHPLQGHWSPGAAFEEDVHRVCHGAQLQPKLQRQVSAVCARHR